MSPLPLTMAAVKGVNFFGLSSDYVVSGSDCGHIFLWDKSSQDVVQLLEGDQEGVVSSLCGSMCSFAEHVVCVGGVYCVVHT